MITWEKVLVVQEPKPTWRSEGTKARLQLIILRGNMFPHISPVSGRSRHRCNRFTTCGRTNTINIPLCVWKRLDMNRGHMFLHITHLSQRSHHRSNSCMLRTHMFPHIIHLFRRYSERNNTDCLWENHHTHPLMCVEENLAVMPPCFPQILTAGCDYSILDSS